MSLPAETVTYNVVAIPYPGRGHVNPMMNLCKHMALRRPKDLVITFIVTEEWLGLIESEPKPDNICFETIPNVIPTVGADYHGFVNGIQTKMMDPVEELLHRIPLINVIICDTHLVWGAELGKRMDTPVASMFNMFATMFSIFYHHNLLFQNGHAADNKSLEEKAADIIDYIPGVLPTRVADLGTLFHPNRKTILQIFLETTEMVSKAQFLIFVSVYELEQQAIDVIRSYLPMPVYAVGPATIPYFDHLKDVKNDKDYIKWLDRQTEASVLYISQGSFLSVSSAQLDEIIAGVHDSGVPYIWISRGNESSRFEHEKGLVIPWCDQLKVLSHTSVGGFWTHCGMNSTMEGAFSGVPMLTFPIGGDQVVNSKMIVEDWKMGRRVLDKVGVLVTREEIAKLIKSFMDMESEEGKEMRKKAKEVKKICQQAISKGGSAHTQIDSIICDMLKIE